MSPHWRLAFRYAGWVAVAAAIAGAVVWALSGGANAVAMLYGVMIGTVSFVSTAGTVSLVTSRSTTVGVILGALSFVARLGFAAVSLGVPAYLGLWPVGAMLIGFVAVYAAENVLLVPWVFGARSEARRLTGNRTEGRAEV